MNFIDLLVVFLVALAASAEARRGLSFALFDILRVVLALLMGLAGYSVLATLFKSYGAGLAGFVLIAVFVVVLLAALLKRSGLDPEWGRRLGGRIGAGVIGALLGFAVATVLVPVLGRIPQFRSDVERSRLAQPALDLLSAISYAADVINVEVPKLNRRAIRFEDEGRNPGSNGMFAERINFLRLAGSMCIECRSAVDFLGYKRRKGMTVSPKFQCPSCDRTSDGCQTFEGFHALYHRCPIEVARGRIEIDCGVWPNGRPVQPKGKCPVCGKERPAAVH
jgi:hypothetical protein